MSIAVIADIHGNFPALRAALNEIDVLGCQHIACLGDVVGYYSMVNECIDVLRERNIVNLLGNHDWYIIGNEPCPRSNSANQCLDHQRTILRQDAFDWLCDSVRNLELPPWSVRHGGWRDPVDEYLTEIREDYFNALPGQLFLSAHTHVQVLASFTTKTYCNPGSVGQPRDGDWRAGFAVLEGEKAQLFRIPYDVEETMERMRAAGFSEHFYSNLLHGTRIGGETTKVTIVPLNNGTEKSDMRIVDDH